MHQLDNQRRPLTGPSWSTSPQFLGENATADEDIRLFRDWLWQLTQFLVTIDSEYENEVKQVTDDPTKPLDLSSASTDTRGRAAKLYGLMSSLVRCRALAIVKAVPSGNGYEALRQLVLAMRPNTQSRGLAMLASLTSWGAFQMNKPLHAQLLKLEEGFEERRKTGVQMPDELKTAMVLRCISGALKTQLSLQLDENATYTTVREAILRWDRSQQKWHTLLQGDSTDAVPMEIDRVEGRGHGKSKGKGKNKGKNDGNQKGKTKGKSKSETGKGKSNWDSNNKGKGKSQKGKGKGDGKSEKAVLQLWRLRALCPRLLAYGLECTDGISESTIIDGSNQQFMEQCGLRSSAVCGISPILRTSIWPCAAGNSAQSFTYF